MLAIEIIAIGKLKNDPLLDVFEDYKKRLQGKLTLYELEGKNQADEWTKISEKLKPNSALIVMDERGQTLSSRDFAAKIEDIQNKSLNLIQIIIGGADGLSDDLRKKATLVMSFGKQTWPHMLTRVMLIEQLYRAQQIIAGHPYHRD